MTMLKFLPDYKNQLKSKVMLTENQKQTLKSYLKTVRSKKWAEVIRQNTFLLCFDNLCDFVIRNESLKLFPDYESEISLILNS